jgi:hypothetical protein
MAKNTYIKRRFRLFLSNSWPRWPRFRSLGFISPLIRRIIKALGRIALLIFEGVTLPSPKKGEGFFLIVAEVFEHCTRNHDLYLVKEHRISSRSLHTRCFLQCRGPGNLPPWTLPYHQGGTVKCL